MGLHREVVSAVVIPSLLHLDSIAFFMGKTVCRAFGASYPLLLYGHLHGKQSASSISIKQLSTSSSSARHGGARAVGLAEVEGQDDLLLATTLPRGPLRLPTGAMAALLDSNETIT